MLLRAEPEEVHTARGRYYPMHYKTMRELTCTDRPYMYKATARFALAPEYSTYCMLAVRQKYRTLGAVAVLV